MAQKVRSNKRTPRRKLAKHSTAAVSQDSNFALILAAVRKIPRGRVSTYGAVAAAAGLPRRARLVGTVLRQSPASKDLPWFRVINASGRISFPAGSDMALLQRRKLKAEGVAFISGRVDLEQHGWPNQESLDELLWKIS